MERPGSGNLKRPLNNNMNRGGSRLSSDHQSLKRSETQQSKQKLSTQQMSISISVNQMKGMEGGYHVGNVPQEISLLNQELNQQRTIQEELLQNSGTQGDPQTLSMAQTNQNDSQYRLQDAAKAYQSYNSTFNSNQQQQQQQQQQVAASGRHQSSEFQRLATNTGIAVYTLQSDEKKTIETQSQYVADKDQESLRRPATSQHNLRFNSRGIKNQDGVIVRKKRVKSTRPCGIRGATCVTENYSSNTPVSKKKSRQHNKWLKFVSDHSQANTQYGASTKADDSSVKNQQTVTKNYAPMSLMKVGSSSVSRLRPRMTSSDHNNSTRPITAVRPFAFNQTNPQSESSQIKIIQSGRMVRPNSHLGGNKHQNKLKQMKANALAESVSQGFSLTQNEPFQQQLSQMSLNQTVDLNQQAFVSPAHSDLNLVNQQIQNNDSFKLISQFEDEQQALNYAAELQNYYSGLQMDVQVKIEANQTPLDDVEDRQSMAEAAQEAYQTQQQSRNMHYQTYNDAPSAQQLAQLEEEKINAKIQIQSQFKGHFNKVSQVQRRNLKSAAGRNQSQTSSLKSKKPEKLIRLTKNTRIEYAKLTQQQIKEVKQTQDQIFGVVKDNSILPQLSYLQSGAAQRNEAAPNFKLDQDVQMTQIQFKANQQAQILQKLGVIPSELKGEVAQASAVMSDGDKIPKSMAKFHAREQKLKKLFDSQVAQWHQETPQIQLAQQSVQSVETTANQPPFEVDVRLYKERGDEYYIIGNKLQYRASEQTQSGQNFCHKQALETKNNFDPLRIRLRIMPKSRAPLAQGKTPDYYFVEAAKKSLSGDLTSAIEMLKRGLLINPNHYICRFNHGVLMFKFGLIHNASKDFESLTHHPHGMKDPWVFYNYATCLIQLGRPDKPLYEQEQERAQIEKEKTEQRRKMHEASIKRISQAVTQAGRKLSKANSLSDHLSGIKGFMIGAQSQQNFAKTIDQVTTAAIQTTAASLQKHSENMGKKGTENYLKAIQMCDMAINLSKEGSDKEILVDALKMKGVCEFRLGRLIKSVEVLYRARKVQAQIQEEIDERRRARETKVVEEIIGYFTKKDYDTMHRMNKKRSKSYQFIRHKKMRQPKNLLVRDKSWANFELNEVRNQQDQIEILNIQQEPGSSEDEQHSTKSFGKKSKETSVTSPLSAASNRSRQAIEETKKAFTLEVKEEAEKRNQASLKTKMTVPLQENEFLSQELPENSNTIANEKVTINSVLKTPKNGLQQAEQEPKKHIQFQDPVQETEKQKAKVFKDNLKRNLIAKLTKMAKEIKKSKASLMNDKKIEELMAKMMKQKQALAEDRKNLNMSKAEYAIFRKTYVELRKQSDKVVDSNDPFKRLKNIYLREFDEFEEDYDDCNILEIQELKKRKAMNKWINEDDLITQLIKEAALKLSKQTEVGVDPVEAELNTRFVEQLLKVAQVNTEEVCGAHQESLSDIIKDQAQMDGIMRDLAQKIKDMAHSFEKELNRGMERLTTLEPKLEEMKKLRGERHNDLEDNNQAGEGGESEMITRLRDALLSDTKTPDEVINILTQENFEKEKQKLQLQYMKGNSDDDMENEEQVFMKREQIAGLRKNHGLVAQDIRYNERHIEMIKHQLSLKPNERNYKILDMMMRHLRFIKTHDRGVRIQIYRNAEFVEYPSRVEIFKKGEMADYMYIVLKGRISCTTTNQLYADVEKIKATVKDGEMFGELALIDYQKYEEKKQPEDKRQPEVQIYNPERQATCRTVEVSRMIRILASEAKRILQPAQKREQEQTVVPISSSLGSQRSSIDGLPASLEMPSTIEPRDFATDELNQRLQFLQSFDMFRDVKNKVLIPVALNMTIVKFQYGEFLARANQRPCGMFLIKSGQCIVGLSQISERSKNYQDIPGSREPIFDKTRLFNRFDPENSLLNNVEIQDRVFQNGRIFVENNEQIRDKIKYHDFVLFSKLFPKNQFGGRTLLPFDIYIQSKRIYFGSKALAKPDSQPVGDIKMEEQYHMKSFLDIVADSASVEAFLITKQGLEYLSQQNLKNVYETIVQETEPDRPFLEDKIIKKKEEMLASQKETVETVKKIMRESKIAKFGVMAVKDQK